VCPPNSDVLGMAKGWRGALNITKSRDTALKECSFARPDTPFSHCGICKRFAELLYGIGIDVIRGA